MLAPDTFKPQVSGQVYVPSGVSNGNQKCSVWLPDGPPPRGGWGWCLHLDYGAWLAGSIPTAYTKNGNGASSGNGLQKDALPYTLLRRGICAVISANLTYTAQAGVAGLGTFKPPSHLDWGTQDFAEKDFLRLVQFVRRNAEAWGLNPALGGFCSASAGAGAGLYSLWNQDYAGAVGMWPTGSSRLLFGIAYIFQGLYNFISDASSVYFHFPNGTDHNAVAITMGAADPIYKEFASPLVYGFNEVITGAGGLIAKNLAETRLYMGYAAAAPTGGVADVFGEASVSLLKLAETPTNKSWLEADYSPRFGKLGDGGGGHGLDPFHNAYHGYAIKQKMVQNGFPFSSSGPLNRLVTSFDARKLSTWLADEKVNPPQDAIMNVLDFGYGSPSVEDRAEWIQQVLKAA